MKLLIVLLTKWTQSYSVLCVFKRLNAIVKHWRLITQIGKNGAWLITFQFGIAKEVGIGMIWKFDKSKTTIFMFGEVIGSHISVAFFLGTHCIVLAWCIDQQGQHDARTMCDIYTFPNPTSELLFWVSSQRRHIKLWQDHFL